MSDWWEMLIGSRREMDPHAHKQRERENKHGTRQETQERDDSRNTEGGAPVNRERLKLRMDLNLCLCCQDLKTLICSNCDCYLSDFLSTQLKFKLSSCAPSFSSCVFNEFFPFSFLVEWTSFPQSKLFLLSCVISPHWVIFFIKLLYKDGDYYYYDLDPVGPLGCGSVEMIMLHFFLFCSVVYTKHSSAPMRPPNELIYWGLEI